jgi:hypothetical protein
MLSGRKWHLLAKATFDFMLIAKEYGFCLDLLDIIERRLFSESPYTIHRKEQKK